MWLKLLGIFMVFSLRELFGKWLGKGRFRMVIK